MTQRFCELIAKQQKQGQRKWKVDFFRRQNVCRRCTKNTFRGYRTSFFSSSKSYRSEFGQNRCKKTSYRQVLPNSGYLEASHYPVALPHGRRDGCINFRRSSILRRNRFNSEYRVLRRILSLEVLDAISSTTPQKKPLGHMRHVFAMG